MIICRIYVNELLPVGITSFLETIENHVASGAKVRIDKLGVLTVKERAARKGRNPRTNEEMIIPASKKVSLRISSVLKEKLGGEVKKSSSKKKTAA